MDPAQPVAEAVAAEGGRILAVGSREEILSAFGRGSDLIDLGDAVVVPGFVDPHMHSNFSGIRHWVDVGPFTTSDLEQVRAKLRAAARGVTPGGWLQAKMLDPSLQPGRPLTRADLDELAGEVPVFILESNGHLAYANTRAFELAGVTADTADPPQGRFTRDGAGALTGRLEEPPAFQPFVEVMPSPTATDPPPPGEVPSCAEGGVLGVLPGIIGSLEALEAIKIILGQGDPLVGRLLQFDALDGEFRELRITKKQDCPVCGDNPTVTELIDYQQFCGVPAIEPSTVGVLSLNGSHI